MALAAALGVGRFVYTPALGSMTAQDAIGPETGALLASANFLGYLTGSLIMMVGNRLQRPWPFRTAVLLLALSMVLMTLPATPVWFFARILAGIASAIIFISAAQAVATRRDEGIDPGVVYAGLGAGLAYTGFVGGFVHDLAWQTQWWMAFAFLVLALIVTWRVNPEPRSPLRAVSVDASENDGKPQADAHPAPVPIVPRPRASWWLLLSSYGIVGAGYIILGTFLVVQAEEEIGGGIGSWFWVVTGLVAMPSTVIWRTFADRTSPALAYTGTLLLQVVAGLLPVLIGGIVATALSAALYGFTFIPAVMLATSMIQLGVKGATAKLTVWNGAGQLIGPLLVLPIVGSGYSDAFLVSAGLNTISMLCAFALVLTLRLPRRGARA